MIPRRFRPVDAFALAAAGIAAGLLAFGVRRQEVSHARDSGRCRIECGAHDCQEHAHERVVIEPIDTLVRSAQAAEQVGRITGPTLVDLPTKVFEQVPIRPARTAPGWAQPLPLR